MHAHRDFGLSLREIEPAIGHIEIDAQRGVLSQNASITGASKREAIPSGQVTRSVPVSSFPPT